MLAVRVALGVGDPSHHLFCRPRVHNKRAVGARDEGADPDVVAADPRDVPLTASPRTATVKLAMALAPRVIGTAGNERGAQDPCAVGIELRARLVGRILDPEPAHNRELHVVGIQDADRPVVKATDRRPPRRLWRGQPTGGPFLVPSLEATWSWKAQASASMAEESASFEFSAQHFPAHDGTTSSLMQCP